MTSARVTALKAGPSKTNVPKKRAKTWGQTREASVAVEAGEGERVEEESVCATLAGSKIRVIAATKLIPVQLFEAGQDRRRKGGDNLAVASAELLSRSHTRIKGVSDAAG